MKAIRGPVWAAFFLCVINAPSFAQSTAAHPNFAAELINVGKLLEQFPNDMQLHFTRGMLYGELGRFTAAADEFRWMLTRDPSLLRPRLELGRVLMEAGNHESARYNFEQVLANELPDTVRNKVLRILADIREQMPNLTFSLDAVSDSNPRQAMSDRDVVIGGLRYRLGEDAKARGATGVRATFDGRLPFGESSMWFVRAGGQLDYYSDPRGNFEYTQLASGRNFRFPSNTFTLEIGGHQARFAGQRLYEGGTWTISDFQQIRPDLGFRATLSGQQFNYVGYHYLTGWRHSLALSTLYAVSPSARWEATGEFMRNDAREQAYLYDQQSLGGRYAQEWSRGWITGVAAFANITTYAARDPFFERVRKDAETRLEADLANRKLRFYRFTPRLQVGWVDHRSNIDFYSFARTYIRIGMTGKF